MNRRNDSPGHPSCLLARRRGYTTLEITMSVLLLMAAMSITVKAVSWIGTERRAVDRRQWALQEVANLLERLSAEPFDRISSDRGKELASESPAARTLPDAAWEIDVDDDRQIPVPAKRVSVRLRWRDRSGGWDGPVHLTSWVHRRRNPS